MKPLCLGMELFLFCFPFCVNAVDNLRASDIRSLSMGNLGVTQSFLFNPSLVSTYSNSYVALSYFNKYSVEGLGAVNGSFVYPNDKLSTAINISSFGFDDYRESMVRLSLSKRLSSQFYLGLAFHYSFLQSVLNEDTPQRLSSDVGVTYVPVNNLLIGVLIMNFPTVSFSKNNNDYKDINSSIIQTGFQYRIINSVLISAELHYDEDDKFGGSAGLEYEPFEKFKIRAGINAVPLSPSFGLGYKLKSVSVDIGALYHSVLGVSSGLEIRYHF